MLVDIVYTFDKNFFRINSLLKLYKTIEKKKVSRSSSKSDILRATVVLTHSTLEDFLRSVLRWKLPNSPSHILNKVSLVGKGQRMKIEFKDIVDLKGNTVDEIVEKSINEYLNMASFNNTTDIVYHMNSINVNIEPLKKYFSKLDTMIQRRHNIVHKADRTNDEDISKTRIKPITFQQVNSWINNMDDFITDLTIQLR